MFPVTRHTAHQHAHVRALARFDRDGVWVCRYPTRPGRVLRHVSIDVPAGTTVALVGSSGSGKSTLIQLMQRFYDPSHGAVMLDGNNIRDVDCQWLRRQIGIVSQEPTLFNGTVLENIKYGLIAFGDSADFGALETVQVVTDNGTTSNQQVPSKVLEATRAANAHEFICRMPEGYNTVIKPDSVSGGQRQRIAIARAILRDPPILLLDEATSALDNRSEHVVQEALDRLMAAKRRTTIVIAHRCVRCAFVPFFSVWWCACVGCDGRDGSCGVFSFSVSVSVCRCAVAVARSSV